MNALDFDGNQRSANRLFAYSMFLVLLPFAAVLAAAEPDIIVADFEGDTYGDWEPTGDAFGAGPARGTLSGQKEISGYQGQGLVNTYRNGDKSTGTLTSETLVVERDYVNFKIAGGYHPGEVCINLLVEGENVRTATGRNDRHLVWETWDVRDLRGKTARMQIVDKHAEGWGHIDIDQITFSDSPKNQTTMLYQETYRPQFHFTAKENWLNDPNGLVFYEGEYHMFFQHNPKGVMWGNMTWGHAVSTDMIHWKQRPNAIDPDELGTIFSGSAVVDWENTAGFQTGAEKPIVAFYTSAGEPFTQSIAYSNDRGRTVTKYEKNPVIGHIAGSNRDPKVIWHAPTQQWIMALYLDKSEFALLSSSNLKEWKRLQTFTMPGTTECPDIFELPVDGDSTNTRWVIWGGNGRYLLGQFNGTEFVQESGPHESEWGNNFYAAQTWSDIPASDGRRLQIGWMRGGQYPRMPFNQQMSIPCALTLRTFQDGVRLCREPVKEIQNLHGRHHHWKATPIRSGILDGITGELFDMHAVLEIGNSKSVGFTVRGVEVSYDAVERKISCMGKSAPVEAKDGTLQLQIVVDRTSIEVFGNNGQAVLSFCFLPSAEGKSLDIFAEGEGAAIRELDIWELKSIWPKP